MALCALSRGAVHRSFWWTAVTLYRSGTGLLPRLLLRRLWIFLPGLAAFRRGGVDRLHSLDRLDGQGVPGRKIQNRPNFRPYGFVGGQVARRKPATTRYGKPREKPDRWRNRYLSRAHALDSAILARARVGAGCRSGLGHDLCGRVG